tara:strand:+ start:206 stop:424 length:219 start_codon:yes stop_codon:yes gene_type:complete
MKYERQTQAALDRLDQSLARLRDLIKRGENKAAINFMEEGELKEKFSDLQSIIKLSYTNQLGASGVSNIGNL